MNARINKWAERVRAGDVGAISRALTAVENAEPAARELLSELFPSTGRAWKIGVTGATGTGKSTLTNALAAYDRAQGKSVGIIAVDPSSPFTGGAILGDRIRMHEHATDPGVYMRSMASRGAWGGLAAGTTEAALVLDAAGKEVIFFETLGVGQDDVDVARVADCTLVVVTPGAGDEVQAMKSGLMEIADIFVVNKADYAEADAFVHQLTDGVRLALARNGRAPKIVSTVATEKKGIAELGSAIEEFRVWRSATGSRASIELVHWKEWLLRASQARVMRQLAIEKNSELERAAWAVARREKDPFTATDELLAALDIREDARQTGSK